MDEIFENYTIFPRKTAQLNGATTIAHINCTYDRLFELFREPFLGDGKDSDVEWQFMLPNGHPISIYNYRTGVAYNGSDDGKLPKDITIWNVNGHYDTDADSIKEFIEGKVGFEFSAHLMSKSREDIIKRLRTICEHLEDGAIASSNSSDYHSWSLERKIEPVSIKTSTHSSADSSYPHI